MNKQKINMLGITYLVLVVLIISMISGGAYNEPAEQSSIDTKFEEIYTEIQKTGEYMYGLSDTHIRSMHYIKPHTSFQDLCPECADLWGKKKEHVTEIPADRLKELRSIKRQSLSLPIPESQAPSTEPVVELTVEEELASILTLLKQQKSHLYTNRYTAEIQYHYLKNHKHPKPGIEGGCPDCINLRKKQTEEVEFIPTKEYNELIQLEKRFKENKHEPNNSDTK